MWLCLTENGLGGESYLVLGWETVRRDGEKVKSMNMSCRAQWYMNEKEPDGEILQIFNVFS